jgi:pimeloyl-ACP methyl ester carboxylesterase
MTSLDLLSTWSTLSTGEIAARLTSGEDIDAAAQLFGEPEAAALAHAAPAVPGRRASPVRESVVLIPGVMGSLLSSVRGITTLLWLNPGLLLRGEAGYLELDDAGQADRHPAIEAVALGLDKLCYLKPALVLRRETELYEFPYDWRRSITHNASVLARALERWAAGTEKRFTLIGHSMGGLVARAYLARHPRAAERRLHRVISLGTPYFGTVEAVQNFALGNRLMNIADRLNPANQADRVMLSMPSLYQLLPAPAGLMPSHLEAPVNWDVYSAEAWRRPGIRGAYLAAGEDFHRMLAETDPQLETVQVAGCNVETTICFERSFAPDERPVFTTTRRDEGAESGDGPVPLWSAVHPKVRTYYVEEQHRLLPANGDVLDAVLELVHGGAPRLPGEVPAKRDLAWPRQIEPANAGVAAAELRRRIEGGTATSSDLSQLYFAL